MILYGEAESIRTVDLPRQVCCSYAIAQQLIGASPFAHKSPVIHHNAIQTTSGAARNYKMMIQLVCTVAIVYNIYSRRGVIN